MNASCQENICCWQAADVAEKAALLFGKRGSLDFPFVEHGCQTIYVA